MRVLISGAGIAGPTLAYWLTRYGFEVTIVEAAPRLRTNGYIVDFWGAGFDIAERMELLPELRREGYLVREVRVVDQRGKRVAGFAAEAFTRIAHGRWTSIPRGELAASIFRKVSDKIETIFGDSVARIEQIGETVHVDFVHSTPRDFDLVVGADGLHSRVRELVFGPDARFEKYLGYKVAAFECSGYRPRDELVYVMYTQVGQQLSRFSMSQDRTMFLFLFADENPAKPPHAREQKALLRERFGAIGWECPRILDALDAADDLYFDRVSQIHMEADGGSWTNGRVTLLGDAAFCISLLGGQGSALAMVSAYILAGELHRANGDYATAFRRYQELFGPFVQKKQRAAPRFGGILAPKSRWAMFVRNQIFKILALPFVSDLAGRDFIDEIDLPNYDL
jgi:2-polyprenyl-6-methoxyphenol hydroxylase-like FAD-dependent oxidoreductase